jgi:hypothetical protein
MRKYAAIFAAVLFAAAGGVRVSAQVQYARGQNVAPVFEGWEHNPDGTYSMVFGYLNRNYEEEVDIPLGQENSVTVNGEVFGDKGQPTHFYERRQRFIFKVVVPKDWDKERKVVWTLTSRGRTDQAKGWLQPEWELSEDVIVENMGGGVPDPDNKPPVLTIGAIAPVTLPDSAALVASATDDGLPKPNPRARRPRGLQITWIQYRGPGKVTFEPAASPTVNGKPIALNSKASFSAPGTYVLRVTANDGQLLTTQDVTVTVNARASTSR